jgi:hypothetical protein
MTSSLGKRLDAIEASQRVLKDRVTTLEARAVSTIFARLRAQIEEVPLLPRQINEAREHFEELGRLLAIKRPVWPYREPDPYPDGMPIEPRSDRGRWRGRSCAVLLDRQPLVLHGLPRPLLRIDPVKPRDCAPVQLHRQPVRRNERGSGRFQQLGQLGEVAPRRFQLQRGQRSIGHQRARQRHRHRLIVRRHRVPPGPAQRS